jgi:hypothetical protein
VGFVQTDPDLSWSLWAMFKQTDIRYGNCGLCSDNIRFTDVFLFPSSDIQIKIQGKIGYTYRRE